MDRRQFLTLSATGLVGLGLTGPMPLLEGKTKRKKDDYNLVILGDTHFDTEPADVYHSHYNEPTEWLNRIQRAEFARNGEMWRERCPRLVKRAACLACDHKQKLDERPVVDPGGTEHQGAPDINYIGGQYVLYYALGHLEHSELGTSGVAVSDSPTGPFRDLGIIVSLENTGVSNSIDPNYFEDDDGSKYLFWGSYGAASGIWVVDLTDDGLAIRPGSEPVKVAGNNMEGTMVHKHGGYYYLFASMGNSFAGGESTYRVVIGRSTSVKGPYTGPNGWSMINDTYSRQQADGSFTNTIMEGYDAYGAFVGTGHNSEILTDDNGEDWMCMHARWSGDNYAARPMILERVYWNAEWPYFKTGRPTISGTGPYFKASD